MKFLVDMPLSPQLAVWLRANGHDADHVSAIGLHNAKDHIILEAARQQNSIIITADLDFPQLLAISHAADPGVILFRGGNYSDEQMLQLLGRVLENYPENKLVQAITVVDRVRIRRCPLPIE